MTPTFTAHAARAGLAAIARYEAAIAERRPDDASAGLAEWLFWWGVVDEWAGKNETDQVSPQLAAALRLARNAATHREVTNGILHSAFPGEAIVGLTYPGAVEPDLAWISGDQIPPHTKSTSQKPDRAHEAYRELLEGRSSREAAGVVRNWLRGITDPHV